MLRIPNIRHGCDSIAYCPQRCPHVFPIVAGRKITHLLGNIKALNITLSEEQAKYLESQSFSGCN
ncbi:hypothetical protein JB92DRAFT_2728349 [Gautieria morchelliformis]|nr:hypothetical protein JB92DRAFT_2728349 [Gautieria morchelliformis]